LASFSVRDHLVGELFKSLAGVPDLVHVPYRGAGPALNDLVAGQVQLGTVVVTGAVLELHRTKKLNLIAVSSRTRLQAAPDVPTAVDEGFANLIWAGFHGVFAPTKTSPDIITRLGNASRVIMGREGVSNIPSRVGIGARIEFLTSRASACPFERSGAVDTGHKGHWASIRITRLCDDLSSVDPPAKSIQSATAS
jgi:tripartite-type tricarboxylate transporter receptor subunit TctC